MVEINQYIKELLLLNDCVIIPEFGGFVSNYRPASIDNNQFCPPAKEISFNNKLNSNDGLLINYISSCEGITYIEARLKVDCFVEETFNHLEQNGWVILDGVGYLNYDSKENLLFEPQQNQNLLVDSYGLQNFCYEKLYQRKIQASAVKPRYHEPIPVVFEKRKMQKLVVALPLLLAMALIPMKNNKEYFSKSDMGLWETFTQSTPAYQAQIQEETTLESNVSAIIPEGYDLKYFIIGGSFRSEENAVKFISQLQEQGYNGKDLGVFNGLHRVAMKGFAHMQDAQNELNSLLAQNPQSGVWIHVNE